MESQRRHRLCPRDFDRPCAYPRAPKQTYAGAGEHRALRVCYSSALLFLLCGLPWKSVLFASVNTDSKRGAPLSCVASFRRCRQDAIVTLEDAKAALVGQLGRRSFLTNVFPSV